MPDPRPTFVPDTSVVVDGRITRMIQAAELRQCTILVHEAVVAELEFQANQGRDTGFTGLKELEKLQSLKGAAGIEVRYVGDRPGLSEVQLAGGGEIDAMIRDAARAHGGTLLTSDAVQSHVARALGIPVTYIRPIVEREQSVKELSELELLKYFDDTTMSVHLKQRCAPYAKKGKPGAFALTKLDDRLLDERTLNRVARECIEWARRDADSFVEIERHGATVVQVGPLRVAIARPPFSDGLEITAVRPIAKLTIEEYELSDELLSRLSDYRRGVFISGPPGSGKSTLAQAVAEYLRAEFNAIVKTLESPRDLQVSDEITQYAPLEGDMELSSDVLLLVRPDFVVYDEVRKTRDFEIFGDMRLAGVGLIGVTHANRAIDAVQRLIGRVELGMIPQVVDTVVHLEGGRVKEVLELAFTVKVPAGMQEADLARPVIEVRDFLRKRVTHEIYTYGEQVVVMPVKAGAGRERASAKDRLAEESLLRYFRHHVEGDVQVDMTDDRATVYVEEWEIPRVIGRQGRNVQRIEQELGVKVDVKPMAGRVDKGRRSAETTKRYAELTPELRKTKTSLVLVLEPAYAGQSVDVCVDGEVLFQATIGRKGEIKVSRESDLGRDVTEALREGRKVTCRV
ncbi:MAG TPA: PINc/VapC family ATPase [Candidatus Thermoplasmatota archaeon]|nr:PINc/VapC family ATPase [Candidatus Thermoplasmatota archaeon]